MAGNSLASNHTFNFTTGALADLVLPTISLSDPSPNATGIARNKEIVLTMSSKMKITLAGGALAKNIFWQVAGQATFGTTSHMEGIILSMTGITFQTSSSLNGRALAQTAVILDKTTIAKP